MPALMGRKKKDAPKEDLLCRHCGVEFHIPLRWCGKCEDHQGAYGFLLGKDVCDRCFNGENDEYLERKKGRAARVAAAIEAAKDPKNWCNCGAVEAYEKWVASEQYKRRFEPPGSPEPETVMGVKVVVSDAVPEGTAALVSETGENNERKVHVVGIVGIGAGSAALPFDLEESGAWPPDPIPDGMLWPA